MTFSTIDPDGLSRMWLGPERFFTSSGPTVGLSGARHPSWMFDQTTSEVVRTEIFLPVGWDLVNVDLWWANGSAGAGDVRWALDTAWSAVGTSLATDFGLQTTITVTAAAQDVLSVSRLATARAMSTSVPIGLRVQRRAADGTDTLTGDAAMLGVMLTRLA